MLFRSEVVTGTGELVTLKAGASGGILDRLRALLEKVLIQEFHRHQEKSSRFFLQNIAAKSKTLTEA